MAWNLDQFWHGHRDEIKLCGQVSERIDLIEAAIGANACVLISCNRDDFLLLA